MARIQDNIKLHVSLSEAVFSLDLSFGDDMPPLLCASFRGRTRKRKQLSAIDALFNLLNASNGQHSRAGGCRVGIYILGKRGLAGY